MSANTRRERNEDLARLASLHAQAVGYIEMGKRSFHQVHALLSALQFFKENRLLAAMPRHDTLPGPVELQQLLSLRLSETHINRKTLAHLRNRGLEYVGELYLVNFQYYDIARSVCEFLRTLDMPPELDLAEVDWIPPYTDKNFFWRMNQPLALFLHSEPQAIATLALNRRHAWFSQVQYAGELFQMTRRKWSHGRGFSMSEFHSVFRHDVKLRAGLYCPKSWAPPPDPPK